MEPFEHTAFSTVGLALPNLSDKTKKHINSKLVLAYNVKIYFCPPYLAIRCERMNPRNVWQMNFNNSSVFEDAYTSR